MKWNESFVRSPFLTLITTRIGNKTDKTVEETNEFSIQFQTRWWGTTCNDLGSWRQSETETETEVEGR